jgi:hypothetical protein
VKIILAITTGAAIGLGLVITALYQLAEATKPGRHYE